MCAEPAQGDVAAVHRDQHGRVVEAQTALGVEVLDETTDLPAPKAPVQQVRDGGIEFEHVTFKYKRCV